jgi:L-serine dehydratase
MFVSIFDLFKIGVGPSSSHTMGPMVAGNRFLSQLRRLQPADPRRLQVSLYGSLALTGKGHGTDKAVILGLLDQKPDEIDPDGMEAMVARVASARHVSPPGLPKMQFDPALDILFEFGRVLPGHSNGMEIRALDANGAILLGRTYYSIGGGFVIEEGETPDSAGAAAPKVPYPFETASEMLEMAAASGLSIAAMKRANEASIRTGPEIERGIDRIWENMNACIERGLRQEGTLPGGLGVKRRAKAIHEKLRAERMANQRYEHQVMDWISVYALAVNEENAAGGRVVTAPTNGAAGVIPAVVRYYLDHCHGAGQAGVHDFLLTAAAVGSVIKHNASISGAEVGCQGEVGSASAMAAAGLTAALGGTSAQIENAAEIALEHHLGMTCDPVAGLVQVPCIERNAFGAAKAVLAASLSLRGDGSHFVPLDSAIETMRQTGHDMSAKYKETSQGGLAVNVIAC